MKRIDFDRDANKGSFRRLSLPIEFSADVEGLTLRGYAAVWDVLSTDRGGYLVTFAKGSVVLPTYDVTLQYDHNSSILLAREGNGTLSLSEDDKGLMFQATLVDAQYERDLVKRIKSGLIGGMSVGVYPQETTRYKQVLTPSDIPHNSGLEHLAGKTVTIERWTKMLLDEVTITGLPAFTQTSLEALSENGEGTGSDDTEIEIEQIAYRLKLLGTICDF